MQFKKFFKLIIAAIAIFIAMTLNYCITKEELKPNIILFGEQLPATELIAARSEANQSDLMIVAGSSLEVYPAAELPLIARRNKTPVIIVDLRPTAMDWLADVVLRGDVVDILPQLASALENQT